jgi:hypothetical protein
MNHRHRPGCPIIFSLMFLSFLVMPSPAHAAKPNNLTMKAIDSSMSYFERYLSRFPPDLKDSTHENKIKIQLSDFISRLLSNKSDLDAFFYAWTLGRLYYYGYNLDMDSAWEKCDHYLIKSILLRPDSVEPKILLTALYGSSINPADTFMTKRLDFSINLLSDLRHNGADASHPIINYNLCLEAIALGNQPLACDAGYEFWKHMPKDSSSLKFRQLFEFEKAGCGTLSIIDKTKLYRNTCFNFQVLYPETLIIFQELTDTLNGHMATINLQSPLVKNSSGNMIRNAISVIAWDLSRLDADVKIGGMMRKLGGGKMAPREVKLPRLRSSYECVLGNTPEEFHTILTFIVTAKNLFALTYVATNSTFDKNLKYYEAFEKGFSIIEGQ